ncbi:MAG: hypothetical protein VKJ04_12130 [Vampirovibrionales bacterium]|nr:hypothetical protein [Vampirovibrionales bacterium]
MLDKTALEQRTSMVIDQFEGIVPQYEAFYIHSIIYAADRGNEAFNRFDTVISESVSKELAVSTVQEALAHAGALSRFFWPPKKAGKLAVIRGERLCKAFDLDDSSPLRSRDLRNAFEHFDENLDQFLLQNDSGYFFPGPMVGEHVLADEEIGHIFRLVDPAHNICVLLGKKFQFLPIREEVHRILLRALAMDKEGCRLP